MVDLRLKYCLSGRLQSFIKHKLKQYYTFLSNYSIMIQYLITMASTNIIIKYHKCYNVFVK